MPPLNAPTLKLPQGHETIAFRAVDRVLREDPVLKGVFGRNIYSWTGDALDPNEPSQNNLPWMRLTPSPAASGWENESQHRMPLNIAIEIAVSGTNADQILNLWAAIRLALFPQEPASQDRINAARQAARITSLTIHMPAYASRKLGELPALVGMGAIELYLLVQT